MLLAVLLAIVYFFFEMNKNRLISFILTLFLTMSEAQETVGKVDIGIFLRYVGLLSSNASGSVSDFYINSGGLYLLPEYLPIRGEVSSVCAVGYTNVEFESFLFKPNSREIDPQTTVRPFVYVVLLRPRTEDNGNLYSLVYPPAILAHGIISGCIGVPDGLQWEAREGDRIGAFIPSECVMVDSIPDDVFVLQEIHNQFTQLCPSQINLVADRIESYGIYVTNSSSLSVEDLTDELSMSMDQFDNISVHINMNVTIVPLEGKGILRMEIHLLLHNG